MSILAWTWWRRSFLIYDFQNYFLSEALQSDFIRFSWLLHKRSNLVPAEVNIATIGSFRFMLCSVFVRDYHPRCKARLWNIPNPDHYCFVSEWRFKMCSKIPPLRTTSLPYRHEPFSLCVSSLKPIVTIFKHDDA